MGRFTKDDSEQVRKLPCAGWSLSKHTIKVALSGKNSNIQFYKKWLVRRKLSWNISGKLEFETETLRVLRDCGSQKLSVIVFYSEWHTCLRFMFRLGMYRPLFYSCDKLQSLLHYSQLNFSLLPLKTLVFFRLLSREADWRLQQCFFQSAVDIPTLG